MLKFLTLRAACSAEFYKGPHNSLIRKKLHLVCSGAEFPFENLGRLRREEFSPCLSLRSGGELENLAEDDRREAKFSRGGLLWGTFLIR